MKREGGGSQERAMYGEPRWRDGESVRDEKRERERKRQG